MDNRRERSVVRDTLGVVDDDLPAVRLFLSPGVPEATVFVQASGARVVRMSPELRPGVAPCPGLFENPVNESAAYPRPPALGRNEDGPHVAQPLDGRARAVVREALRTQRHTDDLAPHLGDRQEGVGVFEVRARPFSDDGGGVVPRQSRGVCSANHRERRLKIFRSARA